MTRFSRAGVKGLPPEAQNVIVKDHRDVDDLADVLVDYLGFMGTEELHFSVRQDVGNGVRYSYGQAFNGILVDAPDAIQVLVNRETHEIEAIRGGLFLDIGYTTTSSMVMNEAIRFALEKQPDRKVYYSANYGGHEAQLLYVPVVNELVLVWQVGLQYKHAEDCMTGLTHRYFHVYPDGRVDGLTRDSPVEESIRACDGTGTGGSIICAKRVLDQFGNCQVPYSPATCSLSKYQNPRQAERVTKIAM